MSFIDWSDSEAMLGLLVEWVVDERTGAEDPARAEFLGRLSSDLSRLAEGHEDMTLDELIERMRVVHEAGVGESAGDPALGHLADCIEEMEKLRGEA